MNNPPTRDLGIVPSLRARYELTKKLLICSCTLLVLALGVVLLYLLTNPVYRIPDLEELHAMGNDEGLAAVTGADISTLTAAWGEPTTHSSYDRAEDGVAMKRYLWKLPDSSDHVNIYVEEDTGIITEVGCVYVFHAYIIYDSDDLSWGTVTPLPHEDEAAYGELLRINFASSRPAVIQNLDSAIPLLIYYTGSPHPAADGQLPHIDTVVDMQYYDYVLEPFVYGEE